uniref:Uncharacterized protein n=1 Tax=Triticum urartu TaxID=4572 RepID=A0A8R7UGB4_TRIUA
MWAGARSDPQLTQLSQPASIHPIRAEVCLLDRIHPGPALPMSSAELHIIFFDASCLALHRPRQAPILLL